MVEITATKEVGEGDEKKKVSASIAYDFGDNLAAAVEKFGEEVVFTNFKRTAVITGQAAIRRMLEKGKTQDEVTTSMADWKPGVALERNVDPVGSFMAKWATMSKAEKKAQLEKMKV